MVMPAATGSQEPVAPQPGSQRPPPGRDRRGTFRKWRARFIVLLQRAAERGEVRRDLDLDGVVTVLFALADGLSWRRAVEPDFNTEAVMPLVLRMVEQLLVNPAPQNDNGAEGQS